jgi:hypothetical protein
MPKVTIREPAVATLTDKKPQPVVEKEKITDSLGRVLTIRNLDPIQQSRLTLGVGSEAAMNQAYMAAFVFTAAMVEAVDDEFYGLPTNITQIEAMLKILGAEGMEAIGQYLEAKAKKIADEKAEEIAAKN